MALKLLPSVHRFSGNLKLSNFHISILFLVCVFLISARGKAQTVSFGETGLVGEGLTKPTSLAFGPNNKLYVSQQNGIIWELTVVRDDASAGSGTYTVIEQKSISTVKNFTPNHNDDGTINSTTTRQITGILVTGTASNPVLYVTSSDWRIGGGGDLGDDRNLDTNSGVLSRLVWNGQNWIKTDLVRGLPRCEENHSTNGLEMFSKGGEDFLLVQQGGNTNMGAPSNNFAGATETFLSGALLIINLSQLEQMENANGGPYIDPRTGTAYVYDLPTLNDPEREDINNSDPRFPYPPGHPMRNATIDVGDPFGGNNGINQAFPEAGGPVQIFAPGFRNAYDVLINAQGRIYTSDNGPNSPWGGPPLIYNNSGVLKGDDSNAAYNPGAGDYVTNEFNITNGVSHGDQLHYIGTINDVNGNYYGGHPAPIRAFPSKAGILKYVYTSEGWVNSGAYSLGNLLQGVSGYFNGSFGLADFPDDQRQGNYTTDDISNPDLNILDIVGSSTNGICEYTASNFEGAMQGDLLTATFSSTGKINRYKLDASGTSVVFKNNSFLSGFGSQPLDVIAQGDNDPFPGTIWAVTYGANNITIFEPSDFISCLLPGDPGYDAALDYDNDGFTNGDEEANGTNPCSAGSQPNDFDNDGISDLTDPDDDNDGIPDKEDPFAIDPDNGLSTALPLQYPFWNNDPGTGFFGLGFTGLMMDPGFATDYLDQFDETNLSFGGAAGKASIDETSQGDALGGQNDQDYGFQFGIDVDINSPPFTIQSGLDTPFSGIPPQPGQEYGIYIGTGDQDNYLKLVIMDGVSGGDAVSGIRILLEEQGNVTLSEKFDVPGLLNTNTINLYISVDPSANLATCYYSLDGGGTINSLGSAIPIPNSFLDPNDAHGLAVGIIATNGGAATYPATWDYINVTQDQPGILEAVPLTMDYGNVLINGSDNALSLELNNGGGATDPPISVTALNISGPDSELFTFNANLPQVIGSGETGIIPITITPGSIPGAVSANLEVVHSGVNSPLQISLKAEQVEVLNSTVIRINSGGAQQNYLGNVYDADQYFSGGKTYANSSAQVPALFQSERSAKPPQFGYNIPVPDGDYTVNMYFAEIFWGATGGGAGGTGSRVFDVTLEGNLVLDNFDIYAEAGPETPVMKSFDLTITDGEVNIFLDASSAVGGADQPKISAIEILSAANLNPVAVIGASVTSGPAPLTVNFTASDSQDDDGIVSYLWDFGDGNSSQEENPVHIYNIEGTYTVTLTVTDSRGASDTATAEIQVDPSSSNSGFQLRINSGGSTTTYAGKAFLADQYFIGGKVYTNTDVALPALFQSERSANPPTFEYQIPVINGQYQVNLYFAEIYFGATGGGAGGSGLRVFDVSLEGALVLDNYDIYAEAGAETPVIKTFTTQVNDQSLDLYFSALSQDGGIDQPKIAAIEIIGIDDGSFLPITIANISNQTNNPGEIASLAVAASGGDPNENFTYAISGQPDGVDIEPTNGQIYGEILNSALTGGPQGNGVHNVVVTVTKPGSDPAQENFTWTVSEENLVWNDKAENLSYTARHECAFVQSGDKFYLFGGRESPSTVDVYDYSTNTWINNANSAPQDFNHIQAVAYDGLIWVVTGFKTNAYPNEQNIDNIWAFNPVSNTWYQGPEIPSARKRGSAGTVLYNNKIYVLGGNTNGHDGGYVPYFDVYDPATGSWNTLADAPRARDHFHTAVINGKLYAAGGRLSGGNGGVFGPVIPEVDVYDFATNTWSTLPASQNIPTPRASTATVAFQGKLFVMGGEAESSTVSSAYNLTEIYDPVSNTWETGPAMNYGRHGTQAIVSGQGIHITAGSPNRGGGKQKNMEYLNVDAPQGNPLNESELLLPSEVTFAQGETKIVDLNVGNGNMGIWLENITTVGDDADQFVVETTPVSHRLLTSGSSFNLTLKHAGTKENASVPLEITYNGGQVATVFLNVGATGPTAVADASVLTGPVPLEVSFTGSNSVPGDNPIASYSWDFGDGSFSTAVDPVHTYSAAGNYTVLLTVTDELGLTDQTSLQISAEATGPAGDFVESFTLINADTDSELLTLTEGQIVDIGIVGGVGLNIRANTNPSVVGSVILDLQGPQSNNRKESVAPYTLFGDSSGDYFSQVLPEGNYTITATPYSASGGNGDPGTPLTINFSIGQPVGASGPTAVVSSDVATGEAPLEVNFTGSGSSPGDHAIASYEWDFGDGVTSAETDPVHTYESPGQYTAILTVTDVQGNADSASKTIEVFLTGTFNTYYVSNSGNDANSGTDPSSPWQTLDQVNSFSFKAGDTILLESGGVFSGGIILNADDGSDPLMPNLISTYNGSQPATIESGDLTAIQVVDRGAIEIKNLVLKGSGPNQNSGFGILLLNQLSGNQKLSHVLVSNCSVSGFGESGIAIAGVNDISGFEEVTLENLKVFDCRDRGITSVGFFSPDKLGYSHSNITVNSCEVFNITGYDKGEHSGNGIVLSDVQNSVIAYSTVYNSGQGNTNCGGPMGIWYYDADQVVIQYNEVYGMNAGRGCDGGGFDLDGGVTNGIIQYNYAHDNQGPGILIGQFENSRTMDNIQVRYNILENDAKVNLGAITLFNENPDKAPQNISIYNNTVYLSGSDGRTDRMAVLVTNTPNSLGSGVNFYNNIFEVHGTPGLVSVPSGSNVGFFGNLYYAPDNFTIDYLGTTYGTLDAFRNTGNEVHNGSDLGITADPLFDEPGSGVTIGIGNALESLTGYKFGPGSPAVNAGLDLEQDIAQISNTGGLDFYGNANLVGSTQDAGAYEFETATAAGPVAILSSDVTQGEAPLEVNFTGSGSVPGDSPIVAYSWDFGDGTTATTADPTHTFTSAGNYTVVLSVTDQQGIEDTVETVINITNPAPEGDAVVSFTLVNADNDTDIFNLTEGQILDVNEVGQLGLNIRANTDPQVVGSVIFDLQGPVSTAKTESVAPYALFGDSSGNYFAQNFPEGSYSLTATPYSASKGGGTAGTPLTLNFSIGAVPGTNGPTAQALSDLITGESPLQVSFTGSGSLAGDAPISSYSWDFGDGNTSMEADPVHTYSAAGTFTAVLTVTDDLGQQDSDQIVITVNDPAVTGPTAVASANITSGEVPLQVSFTGSGSLAGDAPFAEFSWDFGDGNTSMEADPVHTYSAAGTFTAVLTVTDDLGQQDSDQIVITVNDPAVTGPTAVVSANLTSGEVPLEVSFTGSGSLAGDTPIVEYSWDFGDGNTSSEADPVHTYTSAGTFTAVLTVTDGQGLSSSDELMITTTVSNVNGPVAVAVSDLDTGEAPLTINFSGSGSLAGDNAITGYSWNFGDGNFSGLADPTHTYEVPGSYTAVLTVTDESGLDDVDQIDILVTDPVQDMMEIIGYTLVNAETDTDILDLTEGLQIDASQFATNSLNIRANPGTVAVGSVVLTISGAVNYNRVESVAPYALFGDSNGNYFGQSMPAGNYTLTAVPYALSGAGGAQGNSLSLNFSIVQIQSKFVSSANDDETPLPETTNIIIYPNPARSVVHISGLKLSPGITDGEFGLFDMNGRRILKYTPSEVYNAGLYSIPLDGVQNGSYLLRFVNGQGTLFSKQIIIGK
ncbi:PKD domain-containing protein [Robertkochia flava]|uniref:PKD domain-containing protein n=1 Tax=Robertkochia flava TaxID=3447986 RepID=UPI00293D97A8|nr:PKD domain-containing protein [Robertkochia marina]